MKRLNKKGGYTDLFIFMIFTFVIVAVSGIFIYLSDITETRLHETMDSMSTAEVNHTAIIDDTYGDVPTSFQTLYWISIMIIIGMIISIFVGSYLVTTKPVFFFPYILVMIIAIIVSVGISNAYEEIATNPTLSATFVQFTGANFVLSHLPLWVAIIGIIGAIIMFSRLGSKEETAYYG